MMSAADLMAELDAAGNAQAAQNSAWFFKTGPGQYGEGDQFIGLKVPQVRAIAKRFRTLPLDDLIQVLHSPIHEHRLAALLILVDRYQHGDRGQQKLIAGLYHKQRAWVNNWDLVDSSAPYILGGYLADHSRAVLYRLAKSNSLWDRRIAIVSTLGFMQRGEDKDTYAIAQLLLRDKEDLIHKATGWMLREAGKRVSEPNLRRFLDRYATTMPRTMLRYAIERLPETDRQHYLGLAKRNGRPRPKTLE